MFLDDFFGSFGGEGFGAAVDTINDQEALGQGIVDRAIYDQSVLDLNTANDRAALAFEGQYQIATAGPAYDPTEADPYGFQTILGRAIVQQSQPQHLVDDTPLNAVNGGDVGAWASAAMGVARAFATPSSGPAPIGNTPRQIFSNKPGQGGGYVLTPNRSGVSVASPGSDPTGLIVVGLLAVGVYLAVK